LLNLMKARIEQTKEGLLRGLYQWVVHSNEYSST
jgi:hypothetical protein